MPEKCNDDYKHANIQEIPYIASLETKDGVCSGAILANKWVVTSYTCATRAAPEEYKVRASSDVKGRGGSEHNVEKVVKHSKYGGAKKSPLQNNIALVKVKEPFTFNNKLFPVQFNQEENKFKAGKMLNIIGIRNNIEVLQSGNLPVYDLEECRNTFPDKGKAGYFGSLCLGYDYKKTKKCVCEVRPGDVIINEGKLVGLVCFRPTCNETHWHPAVFADIAHYTKWIYKHMKE